MLARIAVGILAVLLSVVVGILPVLTLIKIATLWYKWHDVPGASINNLEEINYEILDWHFPNGVLMYVVIFSQLLVALLLLWFGAVFLIRKPPASINPSP